MTWVRLDDSFADHPKIVAAGPIAALIHIRALCYASRYLTNGFIPDAAAPGLVTGLERLSVEYATAPSRAVGWVDQATDCDWIAVLLREKLWEKRNGGYLIHDYLDYNPSRAEIMKLRRIKAKVGRAGGLASAQARAQATAQQPGSEGSNSPSPSPSPLLKERKRSNTSPRPAAEEPTSRKVFWPSPSALVELYNTETPDECPAVTKLSPARQKKARAAIDAFPDREWWVALCRRARSSRFLRGLKPSPGHEGFVMDFDWLLSKGKDGSENAVKVAEGRYDDRG